VKIGPVDTEMALLIVKTKKLQKVKYIARSAGLPRGLNKTILFSTKMGIHKYEVHGL